MPEIELRDGAKLYYEESGTGKPILFVHGVWMSSRFFHKQLPYFAEDYHAIAIDLRGHGQSSKTENGHTIAQYAKDLHECIEKLELTDVTLVGWSMGAFVIWEYFHQFGENNIRASVVVDELASDFKWNDFEIGAFDIEALTGLMRDMQTNQRALLEGFLPLMFKEALPAAELNWMLEETTKVPASIASAILFDQSIIDCRPYLPHITVPTLLCFGKEEKLIPMAAGEHLLEQLPYARLQIFENSCHCPFLEESEGFNHVVDQYLQSL
ncbi:alpha/beta fold hydrolase [Pontibacillus salicampi]|uniref:Alpha/beta fold hydrolase n=1 Tax=Pontibacillus salicampi TaxID=1449801 RepID=A0ABV6LMG9_9BACI